MKAHVLQIDGYSGSTPVSLRLASHDVESVCHLNGQIWRPGIARLPTLRYDFFDGDFSGQLVAPSGEMQISVEAAPGLPGLALHDARVRLWHGEIGADWSGYALRFDGLVQEQPQVADGVASLSIGVDDAWLDKPFLSTYAGTGGMEGPPSLKGNVKPRLFGAPLFVDAVQIDSVNNVWQLSQGAINAVDLAFDRLSRFGSASGNHATLAALLAASIPAGGWATCLAQGLVRLGAPADGLLTFHARGDSGGAGGWVRRPGAIIGRLAEIMGASAKVNAASLTALDAACPWNLSLAVREQTTPRALILSIAQSVNAAPVIDFLGQLRVLPIPVPESASAVGTLAADGSALPPVASVEQSGIVSPFWRLQQQAEVTQRVHADSDIAAVDPADLTIGPNANRVPMSRFENIGAAYWFGYDPSVIATSGLYTGTYLGRNYLKRNVTPTGVGQIISLYGTARFGVTPGERLSVAAGIEFTSHFDLASLVIWWVDGTGTPVSNTPVGSSSAGAYNSKIRDFVIVPTGMSKAYIEVYFRSRATGTGFINIIEPMVTAASPLQTLHPEFSPGPNAVDGADVTGQNTANNTANVGGTPATTVEGGASKANNGLDGSGNSLTNKVGTDAVVNNGITSRARVQQVIAAVSCTNNVEITLLSLTFGKQTAASDIEITGELAIYSSDDVRGVYRLRRDGNLVRGFNPYLNGAGGTYRTLLTMSANEAGLAAGSYTYTLTFERQGGASIVNSSNGTSLRVEEIKK